MSRVAVFVDAGYLFAQGSTALSGSTRKRTAISLNESAALSALKTVAHEKSNGASLLRVYWYDGALGYGGPTVEQEALASCDDVKLRLGFINKQGQQKGVDSLIVTDLIDLARNSAVSDALLMSGDEDVRIGAEIAQSFGVRVHLLGIVPSRGSQSKQLLLAADTTTEWDKDVVSTFLTVAPEATSDSREAPKEPYEVARAVDGNVENLFDDMVSRYVQEMYDVRVKKLYEHFAQNSGIPREYDGPLLAKARGILGRDLSGNERSHLRKVFKEMVNSRVQVKQV